jgi:hypothetical protein
MRAVITIAAAIVFGAWAYLEQEQISLYSQGTYETLHSTIASIVLLCLPLLVGALVRRPWVLLALLGPLLSLGYLQATGYVSQWHDGVAPLLSPPGIFGFVWLGILLWPGVALGSFAERRLGSGLTS